MPSVSAAAKRGALAAVALVSLLAGGAAGGVVQRDTILSGDTVLGDILGPSDVDIYDFEAPRDASIVLTAVPVPPGNWRAQSLGVLDFGYTQVVDVYGTSPTTVRTLPLSASGTWRLAVGTPEGRLGGYKVRFTVAPGRKFSLVGQGSTAAPPFVFGALAGSDVTVAVRWKGHLPITLDPTAGITGPDGTVLTSAAPVKRRRTSSTQSGFRTTAMGDHAVRFAIPLGSKAWSASIAVVPPRPEPGRTRDLRTVGAPRAHTVQVQDAREYVSLRIVGESGGPNDVLLLPTNPVEGQGNVHPIAVASDGRGGSCIVSALDVGSPPGTYRFVCVSGSTADMGEVVRSGNRIVAFEAPVVRSPAGTGSVSLVDCEYDAALRVTGWKEIRRFDASGNVHELEVSGIVRRADGTIVDYRVQHTGPDGTVSEYDYALLKTR